MEINIISLVLCILISSSEGAPGGKVFGKEPTFPYMASLEILGKHQCGGSILTKKTILTAGHCIRVYIGRTQLDIPAFMYSVHVGSSRLDRDGQRYKVSSYIIHPEYENDDDYTMTNDAAVVYLTKDLVFSSLVAPIQLETDYIDGGLDVIISGWGYTSDDAASASNVLQHLNSTTLEQSQCQERYSDMYTLNLTQLCTWTKFGGICDGDSGGPLVRNGKQVGIVSWSESPCGSYPDVFARISSVYRWIQSVTI